MPFWTRWFDRSKITDVLYPATVELIADGLSVTIHEHSLPSPEGPVPCWTFISAGLSGLHQKEVILTLRRRRGEPPASISRDIGAFYRSLYELAERGRFVDVGGFTYFGGEEVVLGHQGVLYAEPWGLEDLRPPPRALAAQLLKVDEIPLARQAGAARVLARLGHSSGVFPWPPWNDRKRGSVAQKRERTVLAGLGRHSVPGIRVYQQEERVVLRCPTRDAESLGALLGRVREYAAVALLPGYDERSEGCHVWDPGRARTEVIAEAGFPFRVHGVFLLLVLGADENGVTPLEDGFSLALTYESWTAFQSAAVARRPFSCDGGEDSLAFGLAWVPAERPGSPWQVRIAPVSPRDELARWLGLAQLDDAVAAARSAVEDRFPDGPQVLGQRLLVRFLWTEPGGCDLRVSAQPKVKESTLDVLRGAIQARLPGFEVRGGPVKVRLIFEAPGVCVRSDSESDVLR